MSQYHKLYTPEDSVVVFIDHQPQMTFGVASIDRASLINNVTLLAVRGTPRFESVEIRGAFDFLNIAAQISSRAPASADKWLKKSIFAPPPKCKPADTKHLRSLIAGYEQRL
jgi:hypothetical protein